ncbi:MAG: PAS domain S-box protein [Candidatus Aureabacteria bacterium]|nr:PAS domain S-box protein [Candidatus Auribacterota bacterium]
MEDNIKEYQEKLSHMEDRLENYRVLNEYQEKVIAEKNAERIYSRLMGLIEHFLRPALTAVFVVDEEFEFNLFKISDEAYTEEVKKEFDHQVEDEIIPWILNSHKTSIVEPAENRFKEQDVRSVIISPVSTTDHVIGLLMAFKKTWENEIPQNSIEFMNLALKITAMSIENAKINEQMTQKNKELESYKEYNQNINKSLTDAFIVTDENFAIKEINKAGLHLFNYTHEDVAGKPLKVLFPEDKEEEIIRLFNKLLKEKIVKNYDFEIITKLGDRIPVSFSCSMISAGDGKHIGLVAVVKDMTDVRGLIESLQKARDELQEQKNKLEEQVEQRTHDLAERLRDIQYLSQYTSNILQSMTSGVIAVDKDLMVTTFNHAAERITGIEDFEIINKRIKDFPYLQNIWRMLEKTLSAKAALLGKEVSVKNKENREVPVNVSTSVLTSPLGESRGVLCVFSDLSLIKDMHKKLIQSERMVALGEMSYAVAHELRNPLNVIRGLSEILTEKIPQEEKEREYIDTIISQIDRLELLVQKISEYVGQREPVFDKNLVMPFFQKTVKIFEKNSLQKRGRDIHFAVEGQKTFPRCDFDRKQMEQVVFNLLENACDAIEKKGQVAISLQSDSDYLTIKFTDDGKGMPPDVEAKAMEAFFTTHRPERTGLGLAICKNIIERHNGSIRIKSESGKGTTAEIRIPLSQEAFYEKKENLAH